MEKVMDFSRRFERAFVELVGRRLEKQGWKKGEFAAKVWPDVDQRSAAVLWSSVCKAGKNGRPRNVSIAEALRIADVLGEDVGYLFAIARESVKEEQETPQK